MGRGGGAEGMVGRRFPGKEGEQISSGGKCPVGRGEFSGGGGCEGGADFPRADVLESGTPCLYGYSRTLCCL